MKTCNDRPANPKRIDQRQMTSRLTCAWRDGYVPRSDANGQKRANQEMPMRFRILHVVGFCRQHVTRNLFKRPIVIIGCDGARLNFKDACQGLLFFQLWQMLISLVKKWTILNSHFLPFEELPRGLLIKSKEVLL